MEYASAKRDSLSMALDVIRSVETENRLLINATMEIQEMLMAVVLFVKFKKITCVQEDHR